MGVPVPMILPAARLVARIDGPLRRYVLAEFQRGPGRSPKC